MAWENFDNIRGPKGDKGDTGSIASATAESVAADQPAEVVMSGNESVKHAHFLVPRGLPGLNAVPADEGVAAYVASSETATRDALNRSFLNYVTWDGSIYSPRVAGAVNVFIGPVDPGLLMQENDLWTNPDTTTMSDVIASMLNPSSALHAATRSTLAPDAAMLSVIGNTHPAGTFGGTTPAVISATSLAKGGTNGVRFVGRMPAGWRSASVNFRWVHDSATGTAARFNLFFSVADEVGVKSSHTTTANISSLGRMRLTKVTVGGAAGAGGDLVTGGINRLSDNAGDTLPDAIGIADIWLERTS